MLNLRDPKQRIRYRHIVERRRDSHFPAADKILRAVFSTEERTMLAALPKVGKPNHAAWEAAFKRIWLMVGLDSWAFSEDTWGTAHRQERAKPKAIWGLYYKFKSNPTWLQYVNDYIDDKGATKIDEITEYTQEVVRDALKEGIAEGEGTVDIGKRILNAAYDEFDGARALVIARSETVDAFNQASLEQAKDAGSTLDLMWLTSGDDRVREDHEVMDGVTVPYDQEFDCEDGTTMPGEAINCRCTIGYAIPEGGD